MTSQPILTAQKGLTAKKRISGFGSPLSGRARGNLLPSDVRVADATMPTPGSRCGDPDFFGAQFSAIMTDDLAKHAAASADGSTNTTAEWRSWLRSMLQKFANPDDVAKKATKPDTVTPADSPGDDRPVRDEINFVGSEVAPSQEDRIWDRRAWQTWYKSPVWKAIRRHRLSTEPYCRECAQQGIENLAVHVDHCEPHFGEWALFVQYENTESSCERHHKASQARMKVRNLMRPKIS